ncbi:hypothetical protein [Desulfocurvibacter africanus]|uniref:hypothetical protein n=1 Tax=Desulfocurvibacter africanus TaxID=873 RepID=UPI0004146526|nr:hypothetical protein [Desulfocurvibacter africanus]
MSSRSSITSRARPRDFIKGALRFADSQTQEQASGSPKREAGREPAPDKPDVG